MVEVAADLVGRVVDGVHFKTGSCELLLWNHQLLHTAGSGKLAGCVLLFALHAQEANENDEHDGKDAGHVGERAKMDRDRPGVQSEWRLNLAALPIVDAGNHRYDPARKGQQQGKKQQAGFKIALESSPDESGQDKQEPAQNPKKAEEDDGDQQNPDVAVESNQQ